MDLLQIRLILQKVHSETGSAASVRDDGFHQDLLGASVYNANTFDYVVASVNTYISVKHIRIAETQQRSIPTFSKPKLKRSLIGRFR